MAGAGVAGDSTVTKVFVYTKVLVCCADRHDPARQQRCRALVAGLQADGRAVISTQVLQALYTACTRKLGIAPLAARGTILALREVETIVVDRQLIEDAVDCSILNQLSFWDALIVTSAPAARCTALLTEDLIQGQTIAGVRVEHPMRFKARAGSGLAARPRRSVCHHSADAVPQAAQAARRGPAQRQPP